MVVQCKRSVKHDGKWYPVGSVVEMSEADGRHLVALGSASNYEPKDDSEVEVPETAPESTDETVEPKPKKKAVRKRKTKKE